MIESAREGGNAASMDAREDFSSYDNQDPTIDFTPFQAMLCPAVIGCFCLESQKWRNVSVSRLTKVKWNKAAFNQLVLKQQTKKLLSGLVQQHALGIKGRSDFISNKGKVSNKPWLLNTPNNCVEHLLMMGLKGPNFRALRAFGRWENLYGR